MPSCFKRGELIFFVLVEKSRRWKHPKRRFLTTFQGVDLTAELLSIRG